MSRTRIAGAATLVVASALLASCSTDDVPEADRRTAAAAAGEESAPAPVRVTTNVARDGVPVDHALRVTARNGSLTKVMVSSGAGRLPGRLSGDGSSWAATGRLEPGQQYVVRSVAERADGERATRTSRFRTEDLTLDEQTYASVAPLAGETVGVGMPVIVTFDVPVTDRANMERHMRVTSTPRQPGTWHWVNEHEAHWRPKTYWKPGSHVAVDLDINSVDAGNGIYGQEDRRVEFDVGDSVVSRVDVAAHRMEVFVNGDLARTIPISAGKPGWETRSGTKVIIEKFESKRMNAATIGVAPGDPEYYDLSNVRYALRVTYSGEFLHAAPWSVGSQGSANVSHGCVGMSLEDAAWLYNLTKRGDVVEVTGSDRQMTLYNGYGDWNADFATYAEGSALS
ncbi:MAG TPA: Ig-like domain-containing protein [Nocardioides sp.]|nr:Ig-like domain-containing protein [Nocardioides sp.]